MVPVSLLLLTAVLDSVTVASVFAIEGLVADEDATGVVDDVTANVLLHVIV